MTILMRFLKQKTAKKSKNKTRYSFIKKSCYPKSNMIFFVYDFIKIKLLKNNLSFFKMKCKQVLNTQKPLN